MNTQNILSTLTFCTILAAGCSNSKSSEGETSKSGKSADGPALKTVTNDKIGFSILVPEKAEILACDEMSCTYSLVDAEGMYEHNVSIAKDQTDSLDEAVRFATMLSETLVEKKTLENGNFFVITEDRMKTPNFYHHAGGVRAKCSAPPKQEESARKMCMSLKEL